MGEKTLIMTFIDQEGKKCSIRLNCVKDEITNDEVSALMDVILEKKVFESKNGQLKFKDSAQIVQRNVSKVAVK